jgi:ubiquinone/menaquinone biosynthesis C-methylase UbiE
MLKRMDEDVARRCLSEAADSPFSRAGVDYPAWYLHRWHFLPEGYLSRRSAAMYEWCIRNVYYAGAERNALRALLAALRLQHPERVLELGCGPGRAVEALADALPWSEITGLDLSPFQLERAMRRCMGFGGRVRLVHADALALPLDTESYDAVVAAHVAGHLPEDTISDAMAETGRVLATHGKLYLFDHMWHPLPETGLRLRWTQRLSRLFGRIACYEKV